MANRYYKDEPNHPWNNNAYGLDGYNDDSESDDN